MWGFAISARGSSGIAGSRLTEMDSILPLLDRHFIIFYRATGNPLLDYLIGTFVLTLISAALGEVSALVLQKANRRHMEKLDMELSEKHSMSLLAKREGDYAGYKSLNSEANDAFGRVFFNMFTFSAASLWPAFFVLAWMQSRFIGIEFPLPFSLPLLGESVGYVFTFFLCYVLARILSRNAKALLHERYGKRQRKA